MRAFVHFSHVTYAAEKVRWAVTWTRDEWVRGVGSGLGVQVFCGWLCRFSAARCGAAGTWFDTAMAKKRPRWLACDIDTIMHTRTGICSALTVT